MALVLKDVAVDSRKAGDVRVQVASAQNGWTLEVRTSSDKVRVDGTVKDTAGYPFDVQAKVQNADFATVLSPGTNLAAKMEGTLSVQGRLSDPLHSLDAELRIPVLDISRGKEGLRAPSPIVIRGKAGRFQIESFRLEGALGEVSATGGFELNGTAKVSVNAGVDAAVLELMGEVVTSANGRVTLNANVEHAVDGAWDLRGQGNLDNLAIDIGLPFGLTETSGSFTMRQNQIDISKLHGKIGGGDFDVSGAVDLAKGPDVHWQFSEISTGILADLEDRVSGKGDFKGTWAEPAVDGHITIISLLYDRDIGLTDLVPSFRRQVSPPQPSSQGLAIKLDIRVTANDGIYIDTPFAKAEFRTDLHVTGSTNQPLIDGRVEALSGQVIVGRATLDVQEGVVEFNNQPNINPTLSFSATTDVRTTTTSSFITARVTGTLDNFRVYLTADDPTLTETDIVSLLTLGKTAAQLQSEGGGVALGDILALAPSLYGRQVSRNITRILPVDRFEIEPAFSPITGSFEPVLTLGKNLTEQLQASVSTTFGAQTRNAAQLDYRLTPRISLQGTWTSRTESGAGSFGGDIKFRREFRRMPCFSLLGLCADDKGDKGAGK